MKYLNKNKGITLIEIIIVLGLLGIVSMLSASVLYFGNNTFKQGNNQKNTQSDVRYLSEFISNETKNATSLQILDSIPSTFEANKRYIYIENDDVIFKNQGKSPVAILNAADKPNRKVLIEFNKKDKQVFSFDITETLYDRNYNVSSDLAIKNLIASISGQTGQVLCYHFSSNAKDITSFIFKKDKNTSYSSSWPADIEGIINADKTIKLWLPTGTPLTSLIASFTTTGKDFKIGSVVQQSDTTSNNFTNELTYTVIAEDGSTRDYKVKAQNLSLNPPGAINVRIFTTSGIPWNDATLTGLYSYIANSNGAEKNSSYRWSVGNSLDGDGKLLNPTVITGANTVNFVAKNFSIAGGKWVQFEVNPTAANGSQGGWTASNPLQIQQSTDNDLWRRLVEDLYYLNLSPPNKQQFDADRTTAGLLPYAVIVKVRKEIQSGSTSDSTFKITADIQNVNLNVVGTKSYNGVHFSIDLNGFLTDPTKKYSIDSYSIIFDTKLARTGDYATDGWGIALNAALNSDNKDAGYMFQFDPGAKGYVVRRNNFDHYVIPDLGVKRYTGTTLNSNGGSAATYRPTMINNTNFNWSGDDEKTNSNWYKDYTTEITVQRQLDGSLIMKVLVWETSKGKSKAANEMWFGDFGQIQYLNHGNESFYGNAVDTSTNVNSNKSLYKFPNMANGTYIGLRSWKNDNDKMFNANFNKMEIKDGFSMNIDGDAKFLVDVDQSNNETCNKVLLTFDSEVRANDFKTNKLTLNGSLGNVSFMQKSFDDPKSVIIKLQNNVPSTTFNNSSGFSGNKIERGAVREIKAGDINIINGDNFKIKGKVKNIYKIMLNSNNARILGIDNNDKIVLGPVDTQIWAIEPIGNDYFSVKPKNNNNKAIEVYRTGLWTYRYYAQLVDLNINQANQKWRIEPSGVNIFNFKSDTPLSNGVLSVQGNSSNVGTQIEIVNTNPTSSLWKIQRIE